MEPDNYRNTSREGRGAGGRSQGDQPKFQPYLSDRSVTLLMGGRSIVG